MPMACLPMADWYVFLGDWLWSGKGMIEAHTPKIMAGWISQCVKWVVLDTLGLSLAFVRSAMFMAIMVVSSSSVSRYLKVKVVS